MFLKGNFYIYFSVITIFLVYTVIQRNIIKIQNLNGDRHPQICPLHPLISDVHYVRYAVVHYDVCT